MVYHRDGQIRIENMVMQTSVFEIPPRTILKGLKMTSPGIYAPIVKTEDFLQMRHIVFLYLSREVMNHVRQSSHGPAMIKGAVLVGDYKYE